MESIKTKCCSKCGVEKPATIEFFCSEKKVKSGIAACCKECHNAYSNNRQKLNVQLKRILKEQSLKSEYKICIQCNNELPRTITYFSGRKDSLDGLRNECRDCKNKLIRNNRDGEKEAERSKNYRDNLKINNPEKFLEISLRVNLQTKKYREIGYYPNGESVSEVKKRNGKTRYKKVKNDPFLKMKRDIRNLIYESITKKKYSKNTKTYKILGCDYNTFKHHIESQFQEGMNWSNHAIDGWHYDHIIPMASAKTEEEVLKLNHYTNFQPLWWEDNLKKSDKISEEWGNA